MYTSRVMAVGCLSGGQCLQELEVSLRTPSPLAAALHLSSWAAAEPDREAGAQISLSISAPSEGFLWSSLNGRDVWMFVCATSGIKSLLYSYSKNIFQDKHHLTFGGSLRAHKCFCPRLSVKPYSHPKMYVALSSLFYRQGN